MHFWYDSHSISISAYEVMRVKAKGSSLQEGNLHTYILKLD